MNGKWNFINQEGQLLSDQWYEEVDRFQNGFAKVKLHGEDYKLDTSGRLHSMNENKGYKTNKKMKKVVRLTESDLHKLIKESVKKVMNESTWYGDTKPFETIYNAANQIVEQLDYVNDDYEESGDDYSYGRMYNWAVRVRDDAEYYIRENSSNTPINGGEDW